MYSLSSQERKILTLASLGGMLEFYDFVIYGIFSVYFAPQFFPSHDKLIVIMQSYLVFVLGYIARPIGGIIFSHIGDEYGRKKVLIATVVLMGISSLGIGLLPTYAQIGVIAPVTLLVLRLIQGLALGGELPSTYVYISETIPKKQSFAFGITMTGVNSGLLLGMLINLLLNHFLTPQQCVDYGWRIPFLFGGIICLVSFYIRKTLYETSVFKKIINKPRFPLIELFSHHFKVFLAGIGITSLMSGLVVVAIIFMPTYLHDILKINNDIISYAMFALLLINTSTIYFSGKFGERYHPFTFLKIILLINVFILPLGFLLLFYSQILLALLLFGIAQGFSAMIVPYVVTTLFPSPIRLTGVAACYNIGFTLFGGLAPVFVTSFIKMGINIYLAPTLYVIGMVIICSVSVKYISIRQEKHAT